MEKVTNSISIRAHHLLCMQGFQGYGYSQDFIENLSKVVKNIDSNPELKITVTDECDDICSQCPHNHNEICQKEPDSNIKVKEMDHEVLKTIGLENGVMLNAQDIFKYVNDKIADTKEIEQICGDCDWQNKCMWYINQLNKNV